MARKISRITLSLTGRDANRSDILTKFGVDNMSEEKEFPTVRDPVEAVVMKPCPFCGRGINNDELFSLDSPINGNGEHSIECCAKMTWSYLLDDYCNKNSVNRKSKTKLMLIERWNKRTS